MGDVWKRKLQIILENHDNGSLIYSKKKWKEGLNFFMNPPKLGKTDEAARIESNRNTERIAIFDQIALECPSFLLPAFIAIPKPGSVAPLLKTRVAFMENLRLEYDERRIQDKLWKMDKELQSDIEKIQSDCEEIRNEYELWESRVWKDMITEEKTAQDFRSDLFLLRRDQQDTCRIEMTPEGPKQYRSPVKYFDSKKVAQDVILYITINSNNPGLEDLFQYFENHNNRKYTNAKIVQLKTWLCSEIIEGIHQSELRQWEKNRAAATLDLTQCIELHKGQQLMLRIHVGREYWERHLKPTTD